MRHILQKFRDTREQLSQATSPGQKERLYSMYVLRGRDYPILRIDTGLVAVPDELRDEQELIRPARRPGMVAKPGTRLLHDYELRWPDVGPPVTAHSRDLTIPANGFLLGPHASEQALVRTAEQLSRARGPEAFRPIAIVGATATRNLVNVFEAGQQYRSEPAYALAAYALETAVIYDEL